MTWHDVSLSLKLTLRLRHMTHAPETDAINRLHVFRYIIGLEWKILVPKINVTESDVDDEFAETAAIILAGIVAKGK